MSIVTPSWYLWLVFIVFGIFSIASGVAVFSRSLSVVRRFIALIFFLNFIVLFWEAGSYLWPETVSQILGMDTWSLWILASMGAVLFFELLDLIRRLRDKDSIPKLLVVVVIGVCGIIAYQAMSIWLKIF